MDSLLPFSTSVETRSRGYLPHWQIDDAIYFITYRLADSLPKAIVQQLAREGELLIRQIGEDTAIQRTTIRARFARRLDESLDDGYG